MSLSESIDSRTIPAPAIKWDEGSPAINGPDVCGGSPGKEFICPIPVTGERPIEFSASGLPEGLSLAAAGRIAGRAASEGEYPVVLRAENKLGAAEKMIRLVIGPNALALTPPMGWNSWNCFRSDIDEAKILRIARGMVGSGLAARGYSYVNLDSGWQSKKRGGPFNSIIPRESFPDMGALCSEIHAMGLKMGIYSGPYVVPWGTDGCGTTSGMIDTRFPIALGSSGKHIGADKHEAEDAAQWAAWGIDYVKYDWAHTDMELAGRMSRALRGSDRDMVYSVTTSVRPEDARKIAGLCNLWRSNTDTSPAWDSVIRNGFGNEEWNAVIGPGHWFDLDMTAIMPRDGNSLDRDELIACFTCWAIRPSPLLIDCIPDEMDDFTRALLCNEEVISVNQDSMGMPCATVNKDAQRPVQLKPLSGGGYTVAFFNLSDAPAESPELDLADYGMPGAVRLRDLWGKKDIGVFEGKLSVPLDRHCAKLFSAFRAE